MTLYSLQQAKQEVIRAGKILVEEGLIARTWGNISARISETQFVITPSGLPYETLTPQQIVTVNIADGSYAGPVRPSSEAGLHAALYRLRPKVCILVHTHQKMASVVSIHPADLTVPQGECRALLGDVVPCAAYGMPSTKALCRGVVSAATRCPHSMAFLMQNHGAMLLGSDLEEAFARARALEKLSQEIYTRAVGPLAEPSAPCYGSSMRRGGSFLLRCGPLEAAYPIDSLPADAPDAAKLHAAVYRAGRAQVILHTRRPEVVAASTRESFQRPWLDDLAQMAGVNLRCVSEQKTDAVSAALRYRDAVLLAGAGALCIGQTLWDAQAVEMILTKGCAAALYAKTLPQPHAVSTADALMQRLFYRVKYAGRSKGKTAEAEIGKE